MEFPGTGSTVGVCQRQQDGERRAPVQFALHIDPTTMRSDDLVDNRAVAPVEARGIPILTSAVYSALGDISRSLHNRPVPGQLAANWL